MNRENLLKAMLAAKTVPEVEAARKLRDDWIRQNPRDMGVLDAGRSLEQVAQILGLPRQPATN
jgi:hypothetical protein